MMLSSLRRRARAWSRRHSYSFFSSLGALLQHRVGTLMTVLVLGIAILLPLGLYATLSNLGGVDLREEEWAAITVFVPGATPPDALDALVAAVEARDDVTSVGLVSPQQGLEEFVSASGFGASLAALDSNPLPWVVSVLPAGAGDATDAGMLENRVQGLMAFLQDQAVVESVQFDYKWLQRLGRLVELGQAAVWVLSVLFGLAVVVLVANTIRLDVAARSDEIEVLALVGAPNAFIRQPFLYSGLWYGLMGGVLALLLLWLAFFYLSFPLSRLLDAYGQALELRHLGARQAVGVLFCSGLLGWLGAWVAVQRYLRLLAVGGMLGRR